MSNKTISQHILTRTSRCELSTPTGATVIVSVLGAERSALMTEAAGSSSCATKALGVKATLLQKRVIESVTSTGVSNKKDVYPMPAPT